MNTRNVLRAVLLPHVSGLTLDLGAGTAKYKEEIVKYAQQYVACDVEAGKNIDIVCDAHHLSFPSDHFNTVICTQVFEHVQEPWRVAEEACRVLRKGGKILFTVPFNEVNHDIPRDFYRYTVEGASHLFERLGMTIIAKGKYGGFFAVALCAIKFRFFDPYQRRGFLRMQIWRMLDKSFNTLDSLTAPGRMYECVYLVAQK
jgi:ubiquinone/menaquinone biosynthesis C-methylase UbiE